MQPIMLHCCRPPCYERLVRLLLAMPLQVLYSDVGATIPGVTVAAVPRFLLDLARAVAGACCCAVLPRVMPALVMPNHVIIIGISWEL